MKNPVVATTLLLLAIAGIAGTGYWTGIWHERRVLQTLNEGTFVQNLTSLEKLRNGDASGGTATLEKHVFSVAVSLLEDSHTRTDFIMQTFRPQLVAYRKQYRANPAEWTPMEHRLEAALAR